MNSLEALEKAMTLPGVSRVLDIGSGDGQHAAAFREAGKEVSTCDIKPPADFVSHYLNLYVKPGFDLIWASHVLEHSLHPIRFLEKCLYDLNEDGWLVVTVPPLKHEIVGGHVNLYNSGLLLYQLILAGFDCSQAMVKQYGYNISVIVQKKYALMPLLNYDFGDIELLSDYFPFDAKNGFNGDIWEINWK